MAYRITDECISCGACEAECKNEAIWEGDTTYVIDGNKCTECVGIPDGPRCKEVCPIDDCILADPLFKEMWAFTEEQSIASGTTSKSKAKKNRTTPLSIDYTLRIYDLVKNQEGNKLCELHRQGKQVVPEVIKLLDNDAAHIRFGATFVLYAIADQDISSVMSAVPELINLLEEKGVRSLAAQVIQKIGESDPEQTREAIPKLTEMLDDGDHHIRTVAAETLKRIQHYKKKNKTEQKSTTTMKIDKLVEQGEINKLLELQERGKSVVPRLKELQDLHNDLPEYEAYAIEYSQISAEERKAEQERMSEPKRKAEQEKKAEQETKADLRDRAARLFEFIGSVRALHDVINRDIRTSKYPLWWEAELPIGSGCLILGEEESEAWLSVEKQSIPDPPSPPRELLNWIVTDWKNPEQEPEIGGDNIEDEDSLQIPENQIASWQIWLREEWQPWAEAILHQFLVQKLYDALYRLRLRLTRESDLIELVWGHGLLYWVDNGVDVLSPFLVTRIQVELDPLSGTIKLIPASGITDLELDAFEGLNIIGWDDLQNLSRKYSQESVDPIDPWDSSKCFDIYQQLATIIGPNAQVKTGSFYVEPGPIPTVIHNPVIFVRNQHHGFKRDLYQITDAIRAGHPIPPSIAAIVSGNTINCETKNDALPLDEHKLMLPLPTNEEQRDIIFRLYNQNGVTVQGPPGTGKSHSIANLICHMISSGKRVLVTSQSERPLRILRNMIPPSIRPLCISLLGTDAFSLKALEESVSAIAEQLSNLNPSSSKRKIRQMEKDLENIQTRIDQLRDTIRQSSDLEDEMFFLQGQQLRAPNVARWLRSNERNLGFIPDRFTTDTVMPMNIKELDRLYELASSINHSVFVSIKQHRPNPALWPTGVELQKWHQEMGDLESQSNYPKPSLIKTTSINGISNEADKDLLIETQRCQEYIKSINSSWLVSLLKTISKSKSSLKRCAKSLEDIAKLSDEIDVLVRSVVKYDITLPDSISLSELYDCLVQLHQRISQKKGFGITGLLGRSYPKKIQKMCSVDGACPTRPKQIKILIEEVSLRQKRNTLRKLWIQFIDSIGEEYLEEDTSYPELAFEKPLYDAQQQLAWYREIWKPVKERLTALGFNVVQATVNEDLDDIVEGLRESFALSYRQELVDKINDLSSSLQAEYEHPNAHILWHMLIDAITAKDWKAWDDAITEAYRLQELEKSVEEMECLRDRLAQVAPHWTRIILDNQADPDLCGTPEIAIDAWSWRQAESWLQGLHTVDISVLQHELDDLLWEKGRIIEDLVAQATWLALSKRITDEQRSNLIAWTSLVARIGKGTGKYSQRYRLEAQRKMRVCRDSVPVWIMSLQRVVDSFDPLSEPFDLLIVDESSQCDSTALVALFRAKQTIIVGDDKQISPYGVGISRERIFNLMDTIQDIPHYQLYDPNQSLYEISKRTFPGGVITLREHFRSLPEIIKFSNNTMYHGNMRPLREPINDADWIPVVAVKINGYREEDINRREADAVVEKVIELCEDERYRGKSMGVISLLGEDQAQLIERLLLQKLPPAEVENRHLICGNAYHFQGDERDIIFLSMVESSGPHRKAVLNKPDDLRRFNVAASRAKDQMWLFYSINANELHPEDIRTILIHYCENSVPLIQSYKGKEDLCTSDLDRSIFEQLISRGYSVNPRYLVGTRYIDLVVSGINNRLAILCDGIALDSHDRWGEDSQQQLILERLGWKFFHIRASAYYRDPKSVLERLIEHLSSIGIEPMPVTGNQ